MAMSQRESARNEEVGGEVEEAAAGGAVSGEGAAAAEAVAAARLSALGLGALEYVAFKNSFWVEAL